MSSTGKEFAQQRTIDVDDMEPSGLEQTGTAQDRKDMSRLGKKQQLNVNYTHALYLDLSDNRDSAISASSLFSPLPAC